MTFKSTKQKGISCIAETGDHETKDYLLNRKFEIKEDEDISKLYKIGEFIGSGKFGDVNKCTEIKHEYELAAKIIPIHCPEDKEAVLNEVAIMKKLRHARLIQLYDVFIEKNKITLIMELITGGELFERVIDENFDLNERCCMKFMKEILQGVDYIHSQNILHLDLKPENILCLTRTGFKIKIIDFGLARQLDGNELRVLFGTPEFVAPEVVSYDPVAFTSDMWSVGVIAYVLLSGLSPFLGDNEAETMSNIINCVYSFDFPEFKDISSEAKDLIKKLLIKHSSKRYSASKCLTHPWLKDSPKLKRCATVSKQRLKHFVYRRKWQKAVNAIIALQRMGVILNHSTQQPEMRQYLQIRNTNAAATQRKRSLQPPINKPVTPDVKRNASFQLSTTNLNPIKPLSKNLVSNHSKTSDNCKSIPTSTSTDTKIKNATTSVPINVIPSRTFNEIKKTNALEPTLPVVRKTLSTTENKVQKNNNNLSKEKREETIVKTTELNKPKNIPIQKKNSVSESIFLKKPSLDLSITKPANSKSPPLTNVLPKIEITADSKSKSSTINNVATTQTCKSELTRDGGARSSDSKSPPLTNVLPKIEITADSKSKSSTINNVATTKTCKSELTRDGGARSSDKPVSAAMLMASLSKNPTGISNRIKFFTNNTTETGKIKQKKPFSLYN